MNLNVRKEWPVFFDGVIHSYTQIFFSENRLFGWILIIVSFFDLHAGFSGLAAVVIANLMAYLVGFNLENIRKGYYGFNSLLAGLGLGLFYDPGAGFYIVLGFASLLALMITISLENIIGKYGLPYLSFPFLFTIWLVSLASRQFSSLQVSETGVYTINEMYRIGGLEMVDMYNRLQNLDFPMVVKLYFRSLGAIFFQYHLFAGILIAAGLILYSRIAFLLSVTGFAAAWFYYLFIGADMNELSAGYIGFNFILTSIAIGGFFILPSKFSFLWVIMLTPVISIFLISTVTFFGTFQLSVYSLPFNLTVLLFLYILKFRERHFNSPQLVPYQYYSPEKNLYAQLNYRNRFGNNRYLPIYLPFRGFWQVTQAHNGPLTHKGEWKHAWDFELTDDEGKTFSGTGNEVLDYYCFDKPVLAPADGVVTEVLDGIDDNPVGMVNLEHNWGNTLIICHTDHLYSKLSHLKKGSFRVAVGDHIKKGDVVAFCGNSGRSPYPHLHFQLQATPFIGSRTIDYPINHYILKENKNFTLKCSKIPVSGQVISNVNKTNSLERSWHFIPGQILNFDVILPSGIRKSISWEVIVDAYNNTYIWCRNSNSKAWFKSDKNIHYFTHFTGDKKSILFYFYLAGNKVLMGYYPLLKLIDSLPVNTFHNNFAMLVQDLFAPFFIFSRTDYKIEFREMTDELSQSGIILQSEVNFCFFGTVIKKIRFEFFTDQIGIREWIITEKQNCWTITSIRK